VVSACALVVVRILTPDAGPGRLPTETIVAGVVGTFLVGAVLVLLIQVPGPIHVSRVRRLNPTKRVLQAVRVPAIKDTFRHLAAAEETAVPEPSQWFSVVLDRRHLEVWSGVARPHRLMSFPWSVIGHVRVERLDWAVTGLIVTVHAKRGEVELMLPVVGAGPLGMFAMPIARIQAALDEARR
jgi:hypothetical protein